MPADPSSPASYPPPPDYEAIEAREWRQSARDVSEELRRNDRRLRTRVRSFIQRFGFLETEVQRKIREDVMFAAHFAKEPRRTGLHERLAAEWIRGLPMVRDFVVLPKGGAGAIYLTGDGNIHQGQLDNLPHKSFDFKWCTGNKNCYAMHKYIKQGGGHQDGSYDEMLALLRDFIQCNTPRCELFVIADGPYFPGAKLDVLRNNTRSRAPRSHAIQIQELPGILAGIGSRSS